MIKSRLVLFLSLLLLWLGLTYPPDTQQFLAGVAAALGVTLLVGENARPFGDVRLSPRAILYWIAYLFVFLKELIKANLDVAFRVVDPKLPINPGIVKVETRLKSPLGRLLLANSITLTPGTITVESQGTTLFIHWISVEGEGLEERTRRIVSNFEKYLEVTCG
jgi:multicomponent Na+:H+ antiporter subunit E